MVQLIQVKDQLQIGLDRFIQLWKRSLKALTASHKIEPEHQPSQFELMVFWCYTGVCIVLLVLSHVFLLSGVSEPNNDHYLGSVLIGVIYGLMIVGLIQIFIHLKCLAMERGLVDYVSIQAKKLQHAYDTDQANRPSFGTLRQIIPFSNHHQHSILKSAFERIFMDARDHIYDHREGLTKPYKEQLHARFSKLSIWQSMAVKLGILGTFIGLILAMVDLAGVGSSATLNPGTTDTVEKHQQFTLFSGQLFYALQLSFGTSIAGLQVSILLALGIVYLGKMQDELFATFQECTGVVMSLSRCVAYEDKGLMSSLSQINNAMNNLKLQVEQDMRSTCTSLERMSQRLLTQTEEIEKGLLVIADLRQEWQQFLHHLSQQQDQHLSTLAEQRNHSQAEFNGFLSHLEQRQQEFIKDLDTVMNLLSMKQLNNDIRASIEQTGTLICAHLTTKADDLTDQFRDSLNGLMINIDALNPNLNTLVHHITQWDQWGKQFNHSQLQLHADFKRTAMMHQSIQSNISQSIKDLHTTPLGDRLLNKWVDTAKTTTSPLTANISQLSSKVSELDKALPSITQFTDQFNQLMGKYSPSALYYSIFGVVSLVFATVLGAILMGVHYFFVYG